jgi:hypothetical protein
VAIILDLGGIGLGLYHEVKAALSAMLLYNVMVLMTFEVFYLGEHLSRGGWLVFVYWPLK